MYCIVSVFSIAMIRDAKNDTKEIATSEFQYLLLPVVFFIAKNAAAGTINQNRNIVIAKNGTAVATDEVIAIAMLSFGKSSIVLYTI